MTDRELDALVAEEVFGWQRPPPEDQDFTVIPMTYEQWSTLALPHYSTDIAAAWEVVEKLSESFEWVLESPTNREEGFTCTFFGTEADAGWMPPPGRAVAETVSKAICLAALMAVGVGVP
jgi:hypothetical protein